jgi:hypothetical protein
MEDPSSEKMTKELFAVIVHEGSSRELGHYYAFVKRVQPDGVKKWFKVNDATVEEVCLCMMYPLSLIISSMCFSLWRIINYLFCSVSVGDV